MLKIPLYGLVLAFFELAPASPMWGVLLITLGTLSALAGILYAAVESDLKRVLAYSSIEHIGIATVGLGAAILLAPLDRALAGAALCAMLFHVVNDALFKGTLFLGVGRVAQAEGTVDLDRLGGLARSLPFTATAFFVAIGALVLSGALAIASFAKVFGVAFLGQPRRTTGETRRREHIDVVVVTLGALALGCIVLGAAPALVVAPLAAICSLRHRSAGSVCSPSSCCTGSRMRSMTSS
jgi:formate hydrogenlyase subunit 3/multisubunit Na+/H+ antiporter MnhD subunit